MTSAHGFLVSGRWENDVGSKFKPGVNADLVTSHGTTGLWGSFRGAIPFILRTI